MKKDNMLIALYFVFSVALLTFTRTVAGREQALVPGEEFFIGTTASTTEDAKPISPQPAPNKPQPASTPAEVIKLTPATE